MATVKGLWRLNKTISRYYPSNSSLDIQAVNFTLPDLPGYNCTRFYQGHYADADSDHLFYGGDFTGYVIAFIYRDNKWEKENRRTVDFGDNEQTVSDEFYDWLAANATPISTLPTHYYYNGVKLPRIPNDIWTEYPYCWIRKNTTSGHYDLICAAHPWYYNNGIYCSGGDAVTEPWYTVPIATADSATSWTFNKNATGYFGIDTSRTVLWSSHNIRNGSATATDIYFGSSDLVPVEPEPTTTTTITYNGTELTSLEGGQTANFDCNGKKAVGAVSILFGSKGSITYKGVTTEIEKGKTANLLCAGKKFGSDVVVTVESGVTWYNYGNFTAPSIDSLLDGDYQYVLLQPGSSAIYADVYTNPFYSENGKVYRPAGTSKRSYKSVDDEWVFISQDDYAGKTSMGFGDVYWFNYSISGFYTTVTPVPCV